MDDVGFVNGVDIFGECVCPEESAIADLEADGGVVNIGFRCYQEVSAGSEEEMTWSVVTSTQLRLPLSSSVVILTEAMEEPSTSL